MAIFNDLKQNIKNKLHQKQLKEDAELYGLKDTHIIDDNFMSRIIGYKLNTYIAKDGKEHFGDGIKFYRELENGSIEVVTLPGNVSRENAPKNSGASRMHIAYLLDHYKDETLNSPDFHPISNEEEALSAIVSDNAAATLIKDYFDPEYAQSGHIRINIKEACNKYIEKWEAHNEKEKKETANPRLVSMDSVKQHVDNVTGALLTVASMEKNESGSNVHDINNDIEMGN